MVYFHGGGFVIGNLDTHDGGAREIVRGTGAVVLSVDYRLAPEAPFPQPSRIAWPRPAGRGSTSTNSAATLAGSR